MTPRPLPPERDTRDSVGYPGSRVPPPSLALSLQKALPSSTPLPISEGCAVLIWAGPTLEDQIEFTYVLGASSNYLALANGGVAYLRAADGFSSVTLPNDAGIYGIIVVDNGEWPSFVEAGSLGSAPTPVAPYPPLTTEALANSRNTGNADYTSASAAKPGDRVRLQFATNPSSSNPPYATIEDGVGDTYGASVVPIATGALTPEQQLTDRQEVILPESWPDGAKVTIAVSDPDSIGYGIAAYLDHNS